MRIDMSLERNGARQTQSDSGMRDRVRAIDQGGLHTRVLAGAIVAGRFHGPLRHCQNIWHGMTRIEQECGHLQSGRRVRPSELG